MHNKVWGCMEIMPVRIFIFRLSQQLITCDHFCKKNELIHSGVGTVHLGLLPVLHNKCAEAKRSIFIYNALPLLPLYLVKPSSISSNFKMFFGVCVIFQHSDTPF